MVVTNRWHVLASSLREQRVLVDCTCNCEVDREPNDQLELHILEHICERQMRVDGGYGCRVRPQVLV